jgi:hypothetical protein
VKPTRPLVAQQIRQERVDRALRLNAQSQLYANPVVMAALDATCTRRTAKHLLYDQLSETEVALHWVEKGTEGALAVKRQGNCGLFAFGTVLALYPALHVPRGRIRRIPYRVDETPEGALFVLALDRTEVVLSRRRQADAEP